MDISLNGYGAKAATFKTGSEVTAGAPVKITANGTVDACSDGDAFCGTALNARGGCRTPAGRLPPLAMPRLPPTGPAELKPLQREAGACLLRTLMPFRTNAA